MCGEPPPNADLLRDALPWKLCRVVSNWRPTGASRRSVFSRKGTGLGLAIVHRIVTDYGGVVLIESTEGRGTTVNVRFPARDRHMMRNEIREATG